MLRCCCCCCLTCTLMFLPLAVPTPSCTLEFIQDMVAIEDEFSWVCSMAKQECWYGLTPVGRVTNMKHQDFCRLVDPGEWATLGGVSVMLEYVISAAGRRDVVFLSTDTIRPHLVPGVLNGYTPEDQQRWLGGAAKVLEQTERYAMLALSDKAAHRVDLSTPLDKTGRHLSLVVIDKVASTAAAN